MTYTPVAGNNRSRNSLIWSDFLLLLIG